MEIRLLDIWYTIFFSNICVGGWWWWLVCKVAPYIKGGTPIVGNRHLPIPNLGTKYRGGKILVSICQKMRQKRKLKDCCEGVPCCLSGISLPDVIASLEPTTMCPITHWEWKRNCFFNRARTRPTKKKDFSIFILFLHRSDHPNLFAKL